MTDEPRKHDQPVLLRLTAEQLALVDRAAEHAGLSRTGWIRMVLVRESRREVGEDG